MRGGEGNDKIFGPDNVIGDGSDGRVFLEAGDGDDLVDLGDFNYSSLVYGEAGNDKMIGGQHYGFQKLYGGTGDDKMWSINEDQRGQEIDPAMETEMWGDDGNDHMFGNDLDERLMGDTYSLTTGDGYLSLELNYGSLPDYYNETGGDDVIYGYGGVDAIFG